MGKGICNPLTGFCRGVCSACTVIPFSYIIFKAITDMRRLMRLRRTLRTE